MPFIWNSDPNLPPVIPTPVIGPEEVTTEVHVVANTVNVHGLVIGTLSYNTANKGYDVIYELPSLNVRNLHAENLTAGQATIGTAFINTATINTATINTANIVNATIANGIMGTNPTSNLQIATKEYVDNLIANSVPTGGNLQLLIEAAGDLLVGIADNVAERFPVGTSNGSVLVAGGDSNTGVRWSIGPRGSISTHRGLWISVHPDSVFQESTILLRSVGEIVMDDGTRVSSGWSGLTANIRSNVETSGVGYLDTGVVRAQTCYEVWAVRSSGTGNQGLVLHRAVERRVDVFCRDAFPGTPTARKINHALGFSQQTVINAAQSFAATNTGPFTSVEFPIVRFGSPVGNCWVTLEANTTTGNASGIPLSTSRYMDVSRMPTETRGARVKFIFDTTANVVSGNSYWAVVHADYPLSQAADPQCIGLIGPAGPASIYAGGEAKQFSANTNTWQSANVSSPPVADFDMRTFVESFNSDVLMPAGYDQKCLISYMMTTGDGDWNLGPGIRVAPYHQRGTKIETRHIRHWDPNYNGNFGGGNTYTLLTGAFESLDLKHYVPPVPCLVTFLVVNPQAGSTPISLGPLSSTDMLGGVSPTIIAESVGSVFANVFGGAAQAIGPILTEHNSVGQHSVITGFGSLTFYYSAEIEY